MPGLAQRLNLTVDQLQQLATLLSDQDESVTEPAWTADQLDAFLSQKNVTVSRPLEGGVFVSSEYVKFANRSAMGQALAAYLHPKK
jgi:hypothetical protein